jgi:hypothetical protein
MTLSDQKLTPPVQAALVLGVSLILMLGGVVLDKTGIMQMDRLYPWTIATGLLLLFAMVNSVSSLRADNFNKYWSASMYSYISLALCNGAAAWLASGVPVGEAESYKAIYVVVTVGFLVFISMVNMIKKIVSFAEKEEWSQPRPRNRK